jgi:thioesterase domain-containing protein
VYAFEAPGATREENSLSRIEAMAARYLTDLRRLQPRGPYFLGGFCYGAVVAFELAHQLWTQGETVAFLALMGISPSDFPRLVPASAWRRYRRLQPPGWLRRGLARVRGHAGQILRLPPQECYPYIKRGLAWLEGRLKRKVRGAAYDLLWHLASAPFHLLRRPLPTFIRDPERANTLAFRAYAPRTYPGQIDLFLSRETKDRYFSNADLDWSTFASGGVTIHEVPGNDRMMHEPHLHVLAERLDQRLRETQTAAALVWSR